MPPSDYPRTPEERQAAREHNSTHPLVCFPAEILDIIYGFVLKGTTVHITKRKRASARESSPSFVGIVCCADQSFSEAYRISKEEGVAKTQNLDPNWCVWLNGFCKFRDEGVVRYDIAHEHCITALALAAANVSCRDEVQCRTRSNEDILRIACSCPGQGVPNTQRIVPNETTGYFCNVLSLMFTCLEMHRKTSLGLYKHVILSFHRRDHFDSFVEQVLSREERHSISTIHLRDSPAYHDWSLADIKAVILKLSGLRTIQMSLAGSSRMKYLGLRALDLRAENFDDCRRLPQMQVIVGWDTLYSRNLGFSSRTREAHRNSAKRYEDRVRRSEDSETDGSS